MSEDKTFADMRKEFFKKYYTTLRPKLEKYEADRVFTLIYTSIISITIMLIGIIILISTLLRIKLPLIDPRAGFNIGALIFAAGIGFYIWRKKSFENKIKNKIMPTICNCIGNIKWNYGGIYSSAIYTNSNIIGNYNSHRNDDCFEGKYKDVRIVIEECEFINQHGKSQEKVFDGVMVQLQMNKSFCGNTVIRPDGFFHISPNKNLRHTVLEDVEFEKKFDVFTDDEVEARYLITTALMARLNDMKVAFKADKVSAAFYNYKFIIGLHTNKDLFSICSLIKPVYDEKQIFQMFDEIISIIKLIEYFKLDQKIGL